MRPSSAAGPRSGGRRAPARAASAPVRHPEPITEPLYHRDAYLVAFDAAVTATHTDGVVLDRSSFFPGGGGQPADGGTLEHEGRELPVRGFERRDGEVVLLLEGPPPPVGARIRGRIDWQRRYDLMRTHTALHVLVGVIGRDHGALVTGASMEPLRGRMDFELERMGVDVAEAVDEALRREVAADRPVHVGFLTPEELAARPDLIRTKRNLVPAGLERVRVVEIDGLDRQADGGTHVARTGEVGEVRVVGHESKGRSNKRLRIALDPAPPPPID
jgi:misacylated tRNA(Ala) deacylase